MSTNLIKKKEDLVKIFGPKVTSSILSQVRRSFMKRLPYSVCLTNVKPSFYLNDGGMLRAYAVNMSTGEILMDRYCGSADSAAMHIKEQFAEGQKAPGEIAVFFVETMPNSKNHSWYLTVVSNDITPQLSPKAEA